jgi:hypothetical protein
MKKITAKVRRNSRWMTQPECQDLQEARGVKRWSAATACCPGKKAWKGALNK